MMHIQRRDFLLGSVASAALVSAPSLARADYGGPVQLFKFLHKATVVVNAFGDSLDTQSAYFPYGTSLTLVPAWAASTAYVVNNLVQNGGIVYRCTTAGTSAASGGPTGAAASISDGSVVWTNQYWFCNKSTNDPLTWTEAFSLGRVVWDPATGAQGPYACLGNLIVVNGGANYSAGDTWASNNGAGANGTFTVGAGGVITAANISNPGSGATGQQFPSSITITTSTGSGAVLSAVEVGHGTFGVPGGTTSDMVARINAGLMTASIGRIDAMIVGGGPNDIGAATVTLANLNTLAAATIANLRYCYEWFMNNGIAVVARVMPPRYPTTAYTNLQVAYFHKVNAWIRAYCRKETWANPLQYQQVALADANRYLGDGTSTNVFPIGGQGVVAGAMTKDGSHWSPRGAQYAAIAQLAAISELFGYLPPSAQRSSQMSDGFDINYEPGGNCLEAFAWQPSTAYVVGQSCSNSGNRYRNKGAGTSASSGGPTGTASTISDGSTTWAYVEPNGVSVFGSGTQSAAATVGSVTVSGTLDASIALARLSGSAAGTVVCAVENPWSDGQIGTRQSLVFSLGSGGAGGNELWKITIPQFGPNYYGIPATDYGVGQYYIEAEIEISGVANLTQVSAEIFDNGTAFYRNQVGLYVNNGTSTNLTMMSSASEMLPLPNNGKMLLRSGAAPIPATGLFTSFYPQLMFAFNAGGAAGSATLTVKINWWAIRRANAS